MSRYRFELATPADDADLRKVLAETPMEGRIAVTFRREPSYFAAAVVDGRFRQVVAARDGTTGRVVGFGSRSIAERHVNSRPEPIGYLSSLRLLPAHRNCGLLARGYALFRKLHADGRAPLYLTTIAEDNFAAQAVLTSGRAGLPTYHSLGRYHTVAIPLVRRRLSRARSFAVAVRPAREADLPAVLAFLERVGPRRQFFPKYELDDFLAPQGLFRDLRAEDQLLAYRGGELVGVLAGWDQHRFRQTVVHSYSRSLGWGRPLYNLWARLRGLPTLPEPGEPFPHLLAALPVVADDDRTVFAALLETLLARAASGPHEYLLLGLHELDPLLAVARAYRGVRYTTRLYIVCWEDGEARRLALDGRPPYLELGSL